MTTKLKIDGPKKVELKCKCKNQFDITGEGFTDEVSVKLQETKLSIQHDPERKYRSADKGTRISISTTPDGGDCGKHPVGNLTITVTNNPPATASADAESTYS